MMAPCRQGVCCDILEKASDPLPFKERIIMRLYSIYLLSGDETQTMHMTMILIYLNGTNVVSFQAKSPRLVKM